MSQTFIAGLLVALVPLACDTGPTVAPDTERIRRVENGLSRRQVISAQPDRMTLPDRMAHYRVPGLAVAVIDSNKIAWARAYGVVEAGTAQAVDTNTLFQAGSISKPVAALGALQLVDQGILALDADVNRYLMSWSIPSNEFVREQPVTLRALLSHRGGATVPSFPGYARDAQIPTLVQVLDGAPPANTPPVVIESIPGTQPRYSGGGFSIVQMIMQDVLPEPFPQAMDRLVFRPAGMHHSTFEQPLPARRHAAAATGHDGHGEAVPGKWHVYPEMAAAGLWSTATDLARLIIAVQDALAGRDAGLLNRDLAREMLHELSGAQGLGFAVGGEGDTVYFGHDGANRGFQASLFGFQHRGQGAVILTNSENGLSLAYEILRAVALEYNWPVLKPIVRETVHLEPEQMERIAGAYQASSGDPGATVTIRLHEDTLLVSSSYWTGERVLYGSTEHHFFTLEGDWEMDFHADEETNKVSTLQFGPVSFDRTLQ